MGTVFPGETRGRQLEAEVDQIVDEDDVLHFQVAELQIAGRAIAAHADQQQRHALAAGVRGRVEQPGAFGVDAVGRQHDGHGRRAAKLVQRAANGGAQAGAVAIGLGRLQFFENARHVRAPALFHVAEVIETQLVAVGQRGSARRRRSPQRACGRRSSGKAAFDLSQDCRYAPRDLPAICGRLRRSDRRCSCSACRR